MAKSTQTILMLLLTATTTYAQTSGTFANLQGATTALAKKQFSDCVAGSNCAIPADVLANVDPGALANPKLFGQCANPGTPSTKLDGTDSPQIERKILLVTELNNSSKRVSENNPYVFNAEFYNHLTFPTQESNIQNWANGVAQELLRDPRPATGKQGEIPKEEDILHSLYADEIVHAISQQSLLTEEEIAKKVSSLIIQCAKTNDEKMAILGALSSRLYRTATPNTPRGSATTSQVFKNASHPGTESAATSDITHTIALAAEQLFPNSDVIVASDNKRTGVVLQSGKDKKTTVLTWEADITVGPQIKEKNGEDTPVNMTRFSKVTDGKLQEIASLNEETGAVLKKMFTSNIQNLQTGFDPSIIYLNLKQEADKDEKILDLRGKIAVAKTQKSKMLVLMGERIINGSNSQFNTGYAAGLQQVDASKDQNLIIAIHDGFTQNLIHYVSPTVTLKASTTVELDAQYTKQILRTEAGPDQDVKGPGASGNLQFAQKVEFETHPKNKLNASFSGSAQVVHGIGSGDWLSRQSDLTAPGAQSAMKTLNQTNLHLNQIYVNGSMKIPMNSGMTSRTNVSYQGTNVGQKIDFSTGVEIQNTNGMKIYAFVGYVDADLKGYRTDGSILTGTSGMKTGVTVQTKGGTKFSGNLQGIGGNALVGNVTATVPIFRRTKK